MSDTEAFVAWVRAEATPLPACEAVTDARVLKGFAPIVGNARVVALGEPAHGAHEPLALRNCLFRYLVERQGFTAIAIESGLQESRRLRDYVAGGAGDAGQLVHDNLSWGFGRFQENVELIEWMHHYNADPARTHKIRFYGIDMSGGDRSFEWRPARMSLDQPLAYLSRFAPEESGPSRAAAAPFLDHFSLPDYGALSVADKNGLMSAITGLIRFFDERRSTLIAASGEDAFAWARREAVLAQQLEAMFRVSRANASGDLAPDDYLADTARNRAMADNVRWVLTREGPTGRILLFAHDGHVVNASGRGGPWAIYHHPPRAMGQFLRTSLGDRLRIIATGAAGNGPPLPSGAAGTIDRALSATGRAPLVIDFRSARADAPARWLNRDQSLRTNFTSESTLVPGTAMDAMAFFPELTPRHESAD